MKPLRYAYIYVMLIIVNTKYKSDEKVLCTILRP